MRSFLPTIDLSKWFLALARAPQLRPLVVFLFNHMDKFLPVDRIYQNEHWSAFDHPQPNYPMHILIVPRSSITSLMSAKCDATALYADLFEAVRVLVAEYQLEERGYRLITNGGPNQAVPQWHWHLVSDYPKEPDA